MTFLWNAYEIGLWKAIKEWVLFNSTVSFFVGDGSRVKFWKNRWYGKELLCASFPTLYALTT